MKEIECPNCKKIFKIDETSYAEIQKQVRNSEFNSELIRVKNSLKSEHENEIQKLESDHQKMHSEQIHKKDLEINTLRNDISNNESKIQLEIQKAINEVEKQKSDLSTQLTIKEEKINSLTLTHQNLLKSKDEIIEDKQNEIERLRDYKAKLSVKMLGESLEQHCEIEFNKIRATAFKGAEFEKDNDSKLGSKGDYIYREKNDSGAEIISIMFEMKNEADDSKAKSKNEDFFKKLDKDRKDKKCEYAVLVSLLETENDFYNNGIVDVSFYGYEKMYVIRPQFFIPLITILRNAALMNCEIKTELETAKKTKYDVTNFEEKLEDIVGFIRRGSDSERKKIQFASVQIDATIKKLEQVKDALRVAGNYVNSIENKAENELTIKKLTWKNPTMKKIIEENKDEN